MTASTEKYETDLIVKNIVAKPGRSRHDQRRDADGNGVRISEREGPLQEIGASLHE